MKSFPCLIGQKIKKLSKFMTGVLPLWAKAHLLAIVLILCCASPPSLASDGSPFFNRQALFERAFQSAAYILLMVQLDPNFMAGLSPSEIESLGALYNVCQLSRNHSWLHGQKLSTVTKGEASYFFYLNSYNYTKLVKDAANFSLVFTKDQDEFKVDDPHMPIRDARSGPGWNDPIYINLNRINDPQILFDFVLAFKLLLHEFGHKIPSLNGMFEEDKSYQENIAEIQVLADKVGSYIEAHTAKFKQENAMISIIHFQRAPLEEWVEKTILGYVPKVNYPRVFEPFRAADKEGIYVLLESQQLGARDLTKEITSINKDDENIAFNEMKDFKTVAINWYSANNVLFKPLGEGKLALGFNARRSQALVSLWKNPEVPSSLDLGFESRGNDPFLRERPLGLFQKSFPMPIFREDNLSRQIVIDLHQHPKSRESFVILDRPGQPHYEVPDVQVEHIRSHWKTKKDLVIEYRISPMKPIEWLPNQFLTTTPYLTLSLGDRTFDLRGTKSLDVNLKDRWEFHLQGVSQASGGNLKVIGMYLGTSQPNMAIHSSDFKLQVFLDKKVEIPLPGKIDGKTSVQSPRLISVQIGDSQEKYHPVNLESMDTDLSNLPKGSHLRFVFESDSQLTQLAFQQCYRCELTVHTILAKGLPQEVNSQTAVGHTGMRHYYLNLQAQNIKQNLFEGKLVVDMAMDAGVDTSASYEMPVMMEEPPSYLKSSEPLVTEVYHTQVDHLRGITALHFTNQNLQGGDHFFLHPLYFMKQGTALPLKCQKLFAP